MFSLQEFIEYVWDFYNPNSDLYPIKGLTKKDILEALNVYQDRIIESKSNNNEYYTWKSGSMWQHHSDAVARSKFYGTSTASGTYPSVTTIFNDNPSSVKSFNTIHYEGSQGRIVENDSDNEFYNLENKSGWYVNSFETDKQSGTVPEFIEKEGKWFNKISGTTTTQANLDTGEFTVQGIGNPSSISSVYF